MIVIVDSGSTKTDWVFLNGNSRREEASPGLNPNFIHVNEIERIVRKVIEANSPSGISEVHFFGAGCSGQRQRSIVESVFNKVIPRATITIDIDTMGTVIATCGNTPGISCILGTGCNSVFFDGNKIHPNNYGLGYILSDEGAGTWLGKELITQYLYGLLPNDLADHFRDEYNLSKEDVILNTYNSPSSNTWLASFATFYSFHSSHPWVISTIENGFDKFVKLFVINYKDYRQYPVHFTGSIAFTFAEILKKVLVKYQIKSGVIIQKPIEGLIKFYTEKYLQNSQ